MYVPDSLLCREEGIVKHFLTSDKYVAAEFRYHNLTKDRAGSTMFNITHWKTYLEKFRVQIEKGAQFTRLAVQEPSGTMILKVKIAKNSATLKC